MIGQALCNGGMGYTALMPSVLRTEQRHTAVVSHPEAASREQSVTCWLATWYRWACETPRWRLGLVACCARLANGRLPLTNRGFSPPARAVARGWVILFGLLIATTASAVAAAGSVVVAAESVVAAAEPQSAATSKPPNVILILADDLGYGDLGCYGQEAIQTPHLDRLAAEGIRFTQFYAGSTVCAPSRCTLMTGLHTGHAYVRGNKSVKPMGQLPLPSDTWTVAKVFKAAGYTTGLIGKWGLGGPDSTGMPDRQGFDYFFGYLCQSHAHNYYPEFLFRNGQRVPLRNKVPNARETGAGQATEKVDYAHDLLVDDALAFVQRHREGPFFLYFAVTIPHANNEAGQDGMEVPDDGIYANRDWPDPQKGHAAMITRLDGDVRRLMRQLADLGIDEHTLVLFTSDNGPHREGGADPAFFKSSGPLRGIKRDLYEGGIRVPLIARWPGRIQPGQVSDRIWAMWDFLPTIAELVGQQAPPNLDGVAMLECLQGRPQARPHPYLYWEFHERQFAQAVRLGDWKGVRRGFDAPLELYNLADDLAEQHNLADRHPDIAARIEGILETARTESEHWPVRRQPATRAVE